MNTFTSITYSHSKKNGKDDIKKVEYVSTVEDQDKLMTTSYNNIMQNNNQIESFNKLLKNHSHTYEQIGNSYNRNDWLIKEFHNSSLNNEYKDAYNKHSFDNCLNECLPSHVDKLLT